MHRGWTALTRLFAQHAGTFGKEKQLTSRHDQRPKDDRECVLALRMLSSIREYVVHDAFQCARPGPNTTYSAHGSTHITSDYDVSVQGRDAARVTWSMFARFWQMYRRTLDHSFDTNLYCVPLFAAAGMHPALRKRCALLADGRTAVFVTAQTEYSAVLPSAASKVVASGVQLVHPNLPRVTRLLMAAAAFKRARDAELAAAAAAHAREQGDLGIAVTPGVRETYARYALHCKYGGDALALLYAPPSANVSAAALLHALLRATYFAVEAYCTPDTVNVVVIGLQRGDHVPCHSLSYVCSALENLGDLRWHLTQELHARRLAAQERKDYEGETEQETYVLLLKYAKYVHRILHSLEGFADARRPSSARASSGTSGGTGGGRATGTRSLLVSAAWYERHVLRYRPSGDAARVPWTQTGYRSGGAATYVDALTAQVLQAVEDFLEQSRMSF
jgi:hypothetical protein